MSGSSRVCCRALQSLAQLENLCKQLYETTDTATRLQAEKALVEFTNSPDCLSKCQLLLERGSVRTSLSKPYLVSLGHQQGKQPRGLVCRVYILYPACSPGAQFAGSVCQKKHRLLIANYGYYKRLSVLMSCGPCCVLHRLPPRRVKL